MASIARYASASSVAASRQPSSSNIAASPASNQSELSPPCWPRAFIYCSCADGERASRVSITPTHRQIDLAASSSLRLARHFVTGDLFLDSHLGERVMSPPSITAHRQESGRNAHQDKARSPDAPEANMRVRARDVDVARRCRDGKCRRLKIYYVAKAHRHRREGAAASASPRS